jgi:hypothetical protein
MHLSGSALAFSVDGNPKMLIFENSLVVNNVFFDSRASSFIQYSVAADDTNPRTITNVPIKGTDPAYMPMTFGATDADDCFDTSIGVNSNLLFTVSGASGAVRTSLSRDADKLDYYKISYNVSYVRNSTDTSPATFEFFIVEGTTIALSATHYLESIGSSTTLLTEPDTVKHVSGSVIVLDPYNTNPHIFSLRVHCLESSIADIEIRGHSVTMERLKLSL